MTDIAMGAGAAGFNWLPVYVAERAGILKRRGLTLTVKRLGAVDKATAAVKTGEVQAAITPPEGAIRDNAAGGSLRMVGGNMNTLPMSLVARPGIARIEDLRGKKLGTSSLTEGTAIYTMEMLAKHGLKYPGDYEFAVVGVHPARWKALQEGTIDAAVQPTPWNLMAFEAGFANLGEVTDYISELVFTALIVDRHWAAANRATLVALIQSLIEASRMIYDPAHDKLVVETMMELGQTNATLALGAVVEMRTKRAFARELEIPASALAKSLELMQKAGLADPATLAAGPSTHDDSYRLEALRTL